MPNFRYRYILASIAAISLILLSSKASFAAAAEENYKFYCSQCHGLEGKGDGPNATKSQPVDPRDHTSAAEMNKLTDEDIINSIADGGAATSKSTLMPPFSETLTRQEIAALKDYVRKLCRCKGK
ncbi:MAG: cytochrome c [Deltaproteobacteria bacterium]|nr:cytochrome c [Deltaproteobacteria bacterium]